MRHLNRAMPLWSVPRTDQGTPEHPQSLRSDKPIEVSVLFPDRLIGGFDRIFHGLAPLAVRTRVVEDVSQLVGQRRIRYFLGRGFWVQKTPLELRSTSTTSSRDSRSGMCRGSATKWPTCLRTCLPT